MTNVSVPTEKAQEFIQTFKYVLGTLLTQEMASNVAVDKGELKNGIRFEITTEGITIIMPEHAKYVEYPTAPHIIRAAPGKMLHFTGKDGNDVFAKEVHHPGTDAQPFIRPAFHRIDYFVTEALAITKRNMGIA